MQDSLETKVNFPKPGRYVLAVSGGVDSIALLDILTRSKKYELVVVHVDHGIRLDSDQDERLVRESADRYGCKYRSTALKLGSEASEAQARELRYGYLHRVREEIEAQAVITAHHLDDRIETMALNEQRGSGWRGVAPLRETDIVKRPLLAVAKQELIRYAQQQGLTWREDSTNRETGTPRNYLREKLQTNPSLKRELLQRLHENDQYRDQREAEIAAIMNEVITRDGEAVTIDRSRLLALTHQEARDCVHNILGQLPGVEVSQGLVERLVQFVKTARPAKRLPLAARVAAVASKEIVTIKPLGVA